MRAQSVWEKRTCGFRVDGTSYPKFGYMDLYKEKTSLGLWFSTLKALKKKHVQ